MKFTLDETDYQILEILQSDGRITMKDLAEQISMSSPATGERVRRLEDAGIITGYRAVINPERLGLKTHGYIIIDNLLPNLRESVYNYVAKCREMARADFIVSGGKEMIISIYCRDPAHLMEIHKSFSKFAPYATYLCAEQTVKDIALDPRLALPELSKTKG